MCCAVSCSAADIMPGQGLYFETLTQSWRARNCSNNNYGVDKVAYGLSSAACRPCPQGMITSTDRIQYPNSSAWFVRSNTTSTEGFTSPLACVNQAGYGYNGRVSQPCNKGFWGAKDTYGTCVACGYGLTTSAVGAGKSVADCGVAAGFGYDGTTVQLCAMGECLLATEAA
jgi:hypothetical protein